MANGTKRKYELEVEILARVRRLSGPSQAALLAWMRGGAARCEDGDLPEREFWLVTPVGERKRI